MGIINKIQCSNSFSSLPQHQLLDSHLTQSAPHQDAANTSTQNQKKPSMIWTTPSHTSVWTEMSWDPSRTSRLPKVLSDTTGLVLIRTNTQTQQRRLTTTSPQILTVISSTQKQTSQPPKRDST